APRPAHPPPPGRARSCPQPRSRSRCLPARRAMPAAWRITQDVYDKTARELGAGAARTARHRVATTLARTPRVMARSSSPDIPATTSRGPLLSAGQDAPGPLGSRLGFVFGGVLLFQA